MQAVLYRPPSSAPSAGDDLPELPLEEIATAFHGAASGVREFALEMNSHVESFTRQNPGPALSIAFVVGLLLAWMLRRRRPSTG